MKKSILIGMVFFIFSCLFVGTVYAQVVVVKVVDGDFVYYCDPSAMTCMLGEYTGSAAELTIPYSVTKDSVKYSVTTIGEGAFYSCTGLESV